jgi:hypothetical protein
MEANTMVLKMFVRFIDPNSARYLAHVAERNKHHIYEVLRATRIATGKKFYLIAGKNGNANPGFRMDNTFFKSSNYDKVSEDWITEKCTWFNEDFVEEVDNALTNPNDNKDAEVLYLKPLSEYGGIL